MIKRSEEVGCWASKFQMFTEKEAPNLLKHLYLSFDQAKELFEYGKSIKQEVFFTPMYLDAVDMCEIIDVNFYKIRYNDRLSITLQKKIIKTNKLYFMSFDIKNFYDYGNDLITSNRFPLLCVPKYPASFEDYDNFITYGYSDHTPDFKLFNYAKDKGARWFEKHMKLEGTTPLENDWSVSFKELGEVLK